MNQTSTIRRPQRLIAATVLIALCGALAGCSSTSGFDPTDLLDFLDTKKRLPGERKPVFPEGVPGLEQGVPRDLYRGGQQQQSQDIGSAPLPSEQPKSKRTAKSTEKNKGPARARSAPQEAAPQSAAAPDADAAPEEEASTAAAPPDPKPKKIVRRRTTAPPPDQPAQATQSAPQVAPSTARTQQSSAPFPAPLPSGSFSR